MCRLFFGSSSFQLGGEINDSASWVLRFSMTVVPLR